MPPLFFKILLPRQRRRGLRETAAVTCLVPLIQFSAFIWSCMDGLKLKIVTFGAKFVASKLSFHHAVPFQSCGCSLVHY